MRARKQQKSSEVVSVEGVRVRVRGPRMVAVFSFYRPFRSSLEFSLAVSIVIRISIFFSVGDSAGDAAGRSPAPEVGGVVGVGGGGGVLNVFR